MKPRPILFLYQLLIGASDTGTGLLLLAAPALTLHLMKLAPPAAATLPYLSYIGAFVLSTGLACFYGAGSPPPPLRPQAQVVWLLTAITRAAVACFVLIQIFSGRLEHGWLSVALSDGAIALAGIGREPPEIEETEMWIVKIALNRPYTFIVLALLILIMSPVVILRTPTDIFPSINIPVVAVAWTYSGAIRHTATARRRRSAAAALRSVDSSRSSRTGSRTP